MDLFLFFSRFPPLASYGSSHERLPDGPATHRTSRSIRLTSRTRTDTSAFDFVCSQGNSISAKISVRFLPTRLFDDAHSITFDGEEEGTLTTCRGDIDRFLANDESVRTRTHVFQMANSQGNEPRLVVGVAADVIISLFEIRRSLRL